MVLFYIILLFAVGLLLILLELLVTPGFIIGIIGACFWIFGLVKVYENYSTQTGNLTFIGLIVLLAISIFIALKSKVWKKVTLNQDLGESRVEGPTDNIIDVGDRGVSLSMLRPSGKADFNGLIIEVTTNGELIAAGNSVEVIKIENKKIIVK